MPRWGVTLHCTDVRQRDALTRPVHLPSELTEPHRKLTHTYLICFASLLTGAKRSISLKPTLNADPNQPRGTPQRLRGQGVTPSELTKPQTAN